MEDKKPEDDYKKFVLEFIRYRREISPGWRPEESIMGDGARSFADYWNEKPRNYKKLAELIKRHIDRTR